ncbi:MAG: tRNA pseudouridine(55) synthase TruB [Myxococcota bacterium]|nr:tRNA pseudouridine(55) synthase TruB [Myxococcota bacterium]
MGRRGKNDGPDGFLLIDKPSGWTSFDVVARLRTLLGTRRIGHTGTLDPMASGLMVVLVGRATRLAPFVTDLGKAYLADIQLGTTTNTYDAEGDVMSRASPEDLDVEALHAKVGALLPNFRGDIEQRPPAFSAIKVNGERAYAKARRGEGVVLPPRPVTVHRFDVVAKDGLRLVASVACSKGTYIRSLAHDLGTALGVGAHLAGLRRTAVGHFSVRDARTLESISALEIPERQGLLGTLAEAVAHLPTLLLDARQVVDVRHGKTIQVECAAAEMMRALDEDGHLVALVAISTTGDVVIRRGIPPPTT